MIKLNNPKTRITIYILIFLAILLLLPLYIMDTCNNFILPLAEGRQISLQGGLDGMFLVGFVLITIYAFKEAK